MKKLSLVFIIALNIILLIILSYGLGPTEDSSDELNHVKFSGDIKSYGDIGNREIFNFSGDFTVMAWINGDNLAPKRRADILSKGKSGDYEWVLAVNSQKKANFIIFDTQAHNYLSVTGKKTLLEGEWYHIAGAYDGKAARLYVNGFLENADLTSSGEKMFTGDASIYIGSRETIGGDSPFNGSIDDIIIYNKSLDARQIRRIYKEGIYGGDWGMSIPALSYHRLREPADSISIVIPSEFEKQIEFLYNQGYETITYDDYYDWRENGAELPEKPVIIVFDDGSDTVWKKAVPVMDKYGYVGVIGLVTERADGMNGYMDWAIINTLYQKGWQIASHSVNHTDMTTLPYYERQYQFARSMIDIIQNLGIVPSMWIFPFSAHTEEIEEECGTYYKMCSGTSSSLQVKDRFLFKTANMVHAYGEPIGMKRFIISNDTTMEEFKSGIDYFEGMVGHWKFDEPSGNIAYDSSGYGNDAILYDAERIEG